MLCVTVGKGDVSERCDSPAMVGSEQHSGPRPRFRCDEVAPVLSLV